MANVYYNGCSSLMSGDGGDITLHGSTNIKE